MGIGSVISQAASVILTRRIWLPQAQANTSGGLTMLGKVPTGKKWRVGFAAVSSGYIAVYRTSARPSFIRTTVTSATYRSFATSAGGTSNIAIPNLYNQRVSGNAGVFPVGPVAYYTDLAGTPGHFVNPQGSLELNAADYVGPAIHPEGIWRVAATTNVIRVRALQQRLTTSSSPTPRPGTSYTDYSTSGTIGTPTSMDFSPDGNWLLVGGPNSPYIEVRPFTKATGAVGSPVSNPGTLPAGGPKSVRWSKDGTLIALAGQTSPYIEMYAWTGTGFGNKASNPGTLPGSAAWSCSFHPDGAYLSVGVNSGTGALETYNITGGTSPAFGSKVTPPTLTTTSALTSIEWSPIGDTIATQAVGAAANQANIVPFTAGAFGTAFALTQAASPASAGYDRVISYSYDGNWVMYFDTNTTAGRIQSLVPPQTSEPTASPSNAGFRPGDAPMMVANLPSTGFTEFWAGPGEYLWVPGNETGDIYAIASIEETIA